jgi:hypothetical protein
MSLRYAESPFLSVELDEDVGESNGTGSFAAVCISDERA